MHPIFIFILPKYLLKGIGEIVNQRSTLVCKINN